MDLFTDDGDAVIAKWAANALEEEQVVEEERWTFDVVCIEKGVVKSILKSYGQYDDAKKRLQGRD